MSNGLTELHARQALVSIADATAFVSWLAESDDSLTNVLEHLATAANILRDKYETPK